MPQHRWPLEGRLDAVTFLFSVLGLRRRKAAACCTLSLRLCSLDLLQEQHSMHRRWWTSPSGRGQPRLNVNRYCLSSCNPSFSIKFLNCSKEKGLSCHLLYSRPPHLLQAGILAGRNHLSAFTYLWQQAACFAVHLLPSSTTLTLLHVAFYFKTLLTVYLLVCYLHYGKDWGTWSRRNKGPFNFPRALVITKLFILSFWPHYSFQFHSTWLIPIL